MKRVLASAILVMVATPLMADTPVTRLMEQETRALRSISGDRMASYLSRPGTGIEYSRDWLTRQSVDGDDAQSACLAEALQLSFTEVLFVAPDDLCRFVRKLAFQHLRELDGDHAEGHDTGIAGLDYHVVDAFCDCSGVDVDVFRFLSE